MTSYILFIAALTLSADGQDIVYYKCTDSQIVVNSTFEFSCDAGKIIIVKSAIIGSTDRFNPPNQCPITNNTCLKETTIPAELCTGRNSCFINQNFLFANEWKIPCSYRSSSTTAGNFITINYICIIPVSSKYGDICHFKERLYINDSVYIASYPNFPDDMGPNVSYQCSCLFTSASSSSPNYVSIRALLVQLTGAFTTCSERLSIGDSKTDTGLTFCSPCNNVNNATIIPVASDAVILFRRDPFVSPFNGKFLLEITVSSTSSESGSMGSMRCGYVDSVTSSSTSVSTISRSYISTTTTTSAILSQPNRFSSTSVQNTSLGSTMKSRDVSTQQNILLSSTNTASDTQNVALFSSTAPSNGDGRPTSDSQAAAGKKSISTGAIVGIVLGVFGFLAALLLAALFAIKHLRSKQKGTHSTELMPQASDPRLNPSSANKNPDYENTTEANGLQVNRTRNSQFPNMQDKQGPPEHAYYNESISAVMPLPDNNNQYEPLRVADNQQQTYYNHPSEENSYQPLSLH